MRIFISYLIPLLMFSFTSLESFGNQYFLSSSKGNDSNSGTIDSPWKSLEKISSIQLAPGDSVLFERNNRFDGHFVVNGSGNSSNPITISSYGNGALPIITGEVGEVGGGDYQEAILVENNDHIHFKDIEVQNERMVSRKGVRDQDAYGILILNSGDKVLSNFTFQQVTFKNVYAPQPILKDAGENAFNSLQVSALRVFSTQNRVPGKEKSIRNVLVENCHFSDLQRLGIHLKHGGGQKGVGDKKSNSNSDLIVRNNEFHNTGGTCVLPIRSYNCLIENNLFNHPGDNSDPRMPARGSSVWTWNCQNTVIQYNKCLHIRGYLDSHGIHIDHKNKDTFIQYNYMEDCEGGFVEILGGNVNAVYRFNISVNDGWRENPKWKTSNHTIWINNVLPKGNLESNENYIYNNTVYMDRDYDTSVSINAKNTHIFNNIFYAKQGSIGTKHVMIKDHGTVFSMSHNLFQGRVDHKFQNRDSNAIFGDPMFTNANGGNDKGYQLQPGSPALNTGLTNPGPPIPGAGKGIFAHIAPYPTVDYYGNPIDLQNGTPNIGAVNNK